jgi:plastocyanin
MPAMFETQNQEDTRSPEASPNRLIWWAIGGAVGTAAVVALAVLTLIVSRPEPAPNGPAQPPSAATPGESSGSGPAALTLVATEFAFEPPAAIGATEVEITLENQGAVLHNLVIEGVEGFILEAGPGAVSTGTVQLGTGTYTFFCNVPGHRQAGMEGRLTISG